MIKELFFEGKNIDEAKAKAAAALGQDEDLLVFELVTMPAKGIFGFGAVNAKIKVEVEEPDPVVEEKPTPKTPMPIFEEKIAKKQAPAKAEKKQAERNAADKPPVTATQKGAEVTDERAEKIIAFLKGAAENMGLTETEVKVYETDEKALLAEISGPKMGVIIGHRGETLDALQYLATLAVNHGREEEIKLVLDTENYRAKRIAALENMARKTADKVLKYKRNITLEPMTPYERRIIHSALGEKSGITTYSVGSEPKRKVVIKYER